MQCNPYTPAASKKHVTHEIEKQASYKAKMLMMNYAKNTKSEKLACWNCFFIVRQHLPVFCLTNCQGLAGSMKNSNATK